MHFVMITFDNGFSISRQTSPVFSAGGCLFTSTVGMGATFTGAARRGAGCRGGACFRRLRSRAVWGDAGGWFVGRGRAPCREQGCGQ